MRILVSNDDGIYSPGIATLAEVAAEFGEVRVVAPDVERSSTGHAITASRPLSSRATRVGPFSAYRVDGTPADCVALGAHLWGEVDLVLSGLNIGLNLGSSIWHSGTLAAAKQAAMLGLRGVALSAPATADPDFAPYKPWIRRAIQTVLGSTLRLVNVNFPREPKGLLWTRVSVRQYDGKIVPTHDRKRTAKCLAQALVADIPEEDAARLSDIFEGRVTKGDPALQKKWLTIDAKSAPARNAQVLGQVDKLCPDLGPYVKQMM